MADISKLDDISKLQNYEDYIANNITEWEAESIARVCRKIGRIGRMSKKELESILQPELYIGRCAEQVEHFVEKAAPLISDIKRQSAQIEL